MSKIFAFILVILFIILCCETYNNTVDGTEVLNKGDKFLYSNHWGSVDPIYSERIDTVQVIEIRGKYIRYKTIKWNHDDSSIDTYDNFKKYIKSLDYANNTGTN